MIHRQDQRTITEKQAVIESLQQKLTDLRTSGLADYIPAEQRLAVMASQIHALQQAIVVMQHDSRKQATTIQMLREAVNEAAMAAALKELAYAEKLAEEESAPRHKKRPHPKK